MSYKRYVDRLRGRKTILRSKLEKANDLRREVGLPTYDVSRQTAQHEPILTKQAYDALVKDQRAFRSYRRDQLVHTVLPYPTSSDTWEHQRAVSLRRAFLEFQIKVAWENQALTKL